MLIVFVSPRSFHQAGSWLDTLIWVGLPGWSAQRRDCNQYRILVKFPDNYWLTVGKKPYFLSELHFREPGENAVNGKRPVVRAFAFSSSTLYLAAARFHGQAD